jgi:type II secretory pathway predicted ATPase ExeA
MNRTATPNHSAPQTMTPLPTPPETDTAAQLRRVAASIETYRADLGLQKAPLLRQYPELGSDKTFGKITLGDFSQLDTDKWLAAYEHVWQQIQHEDQGGDDGLIECLAAPVELCRSYLETRNEKSNARFILLLGDSGLGKTSAVQVMKSKPYGGLIYDLEATDVWKDKQGRGTATPLLRAIGERLGLKDLPGARDRLLTVIVGKLKEKRVCLVIEEVHHLCPQGVNTLKTLINLTPVIIIATGLPVLWDKLAGSRAAWAECKQLTGNRLAERIELRLTLADIHAFLVQRLSAGIATENFLEKVSALLAQEAVTRGNMKFVAKVAQTFQRQVSKGEDATPETFKNAIAIEKKKR